MSGLGRVSGFLALAEVAKPRVWDGRLHKLKAVVVRVKCCEKAHKYKGAYCPKGACAMYSPSTELKDEATGCGHGTATSKQGGILQEKT